MSIGRALVLVLVAAGFGLLPRSADAGTITVAWDLMTQDNVTGYRVYVGTSTRRYTQTFDVAADKDFFIFRNAFMGVRYYFAVAAEFDNATYSPQSAEVTAVGTRTVGGSLPGGVRVADPLTGDCELDCFVVSDVAQGLGEISSLAVTNDGMVFAIEGGRRVVVLRGGTSVTAFEAEAGTRLRDLALDPRFATTGRVFVSMLRPHDGSAGDLEVLRLRYLAGSLGEPATILTGPSLPLDAKAPLAVGDDALIYVALPLLPARHPYAAAVLAFDQDGRARAGQPSLVAARGFEAPIDMAWDGASRSMWLLGRNGAADVQLLSVSTAGAGAALADVAAPGESAIGIAVLSGTSRRRLVAAGVDLIEAAPGTPDSLRISLEAFGTPVAVAAGPGARYAATRNDGAAPTYRVVKVEDGSAHAAR
jgi:hypothetical protein